MAWFDANLEPDFFNTNPGGSFIDRKAFLAQIGRGPSAKAIREHDVLIRSLGDFGQAADSVAAEQALLRGIMVNNKHYDDLQGGVLAEHFYVPLHAAIFNKGREAKPITLRESLRHTPFDADNALFPLLTSMFEAAGLASHVKSLAEVIRTAYLQRQLMGLGDSLLAQASRSERPSCRSERHSRQSYSCRTTSVARLQQEASVSLSSAGNFGS